MLSNSENLKFREECEKIKPLYPPPCRRPDSAKRGVGKFRQTGKEGATAQPTGGEKVPCLEKINMYKHLRILCSIFLSLFDRPRKKQFGTTGFSASAKMPIPFPFQSLSHRFLWYPLGPDSAKLNQGPISRGPSCGNWPKGGQQLP